MHELQRQRVTLSPLHILPIYVYTYELTGDGEQIYSAMNRAMRLHDEEAIDFWRPLIWQIDRVLLLLPPKRAKLYRGIGVHFNETSYKTGSQVSAVSRGPSCTTPSLCPTTLAPCPPCILCVVVGRSPHPLTRFGAVGAPSPAFGWSPVLIDGEGGDHDDEWRDSAYS